MSPLDLNNNFIKTTYDISLDSQISFLPLGFSPTIYLLITHFHWFIYHLAAELVMGILRRLYDYLIYYLIYYLSYMFLSGSVGEISKQNDRNRRDKPTAPKHFAWSGHAATVKCCENYEPILMGLLFSFH